METLSPGLTRDWQEDLYVDSQFRHLVPAHSWNFFAERLWPLNEVCTGAIWDTLFAGIRAPFHFEHANGWMGSIFRRVTSTCSDIRSESATVEESFVSTLGWDSNATAFLFFPGRLVYASVWSELVGLYRRRWLPLDTFVIASDASSRLAMYWEGFGPYFEKRGKRVLLS